MAWKVVEYETRQVPWNGEVEGELYRALLRNRKTGKEMEFELFDGTYYGEEGKELRIVEVVIDGAVDFSEIFSEEERPKVLCELKERYKDIISERLSSQIFCL
jgi:hypothetical protein